MQKARMLGNYVEYLADKKGLSFSDLGNAIGCDEQKVYSFVKGLFICQRSVICVLFANFCIGETLGSFCNGASIRKFRTLQSNCG